MAVESANTVGYTTASVAKDTYYMLGLQYENVGGGAILVQDLVKGTFQGVNFDENGAFLQTAPQLQVWTPSGYNTYFYLNDAYDAVINDGTVYTGWADNFGNYVTATVSAGQGAWFKDPNEACTVTTPGQVVATAATVSAAADVYTMGSVPYPVATPVNGNSTTWTGISGVNFDENGAFLQTAPQLQAWTPSGYNTYFYLNDAYDAVINDGTVYTGWADNFGNYVTGSLPVGYGFWLKPTTAVTAGFTSPISAN